MCGIAGIWNFEKARSYEREIQAMTDILSHRGPDDEGIWHDNSADLWLGHRRLSILDLSEHGKQPMFYLGRYVIVYNGEIYNYIELQNYLRSKGYKFVSSSDTEVIMAAYDHWGVDCITYFDGMFAFALYDIISQELFCARDRFGEKPFYYYLDKNLFCFASEIKALWATGIEKTINEKMVYYFLNFNLHENPNDNTETFYKNIIKLKAGHYFKLTKNSEIVQTPYWFVDPANLNNDISFEEACIKFKDLFYTSVSRRLRSDVPVGTSLSGGLDSSSVVGVLNDILEDCPSEAFSARFYDENLDEGYYINKVLENRNIEPHNVWVDYPDLIRDLPKIMYHQDEPFAGASVFAQWKVYELAKQKNVTVLLDGQGADEYLAGYTRFFISYCREVYLKRGSDGLKEVEKDIFLNNNLTYDFKIDNRFKLETKYSGLFSMLRKIKSKFGGVCRQQNISDELYKEFGKYKAPFHNYMNLKAELFQYTFNSGLEKLLRFADRNSMAFSREVRLPFLSPEIVEFALSLPSEYLIKSGWTKALIRFGLKDILPDEIAWRKLKLGFDPPQKQWEKTELWKEFANDYHQIAVKNKWIKSDSALSWNSVNLGLFYSIEKG